MEEETEGGGDDALGLKMGKTTRLLKHSFSLHIFSMLRVSVPKVEICLAVDRKPLLELLTSLLV